MGDIFSYILLAGIIGGGIWGVTVKVRKFFNFINKNGWQPIRKKVRDFFIRILQVTIYTIVGMSYLSGLVFVPLYFDEMLENESYANLFIFAYLILGLLVGYYVNGTKRQKTKNFIEILSQDFTGFKNWIKDFVQGIGTLIKALLVLAGWLLAIAAVIGLIALSIWLIVALGPLWIIVIILILIFLAIAGR